MPVTIKYKGKWVFNWFSNMIAFTEPIVYQGIKYFAVENFYQAMKIPKDNIELRREIASLTPHKSKSKIKKCTWREDWTREMALEVMEAALRHKWSQEPFRTELIDFKGDIIEYNNWNDTYWGVSIYSLKGDNHLGKLLMKIRKDLQEQNGR